MKWLPEPRVPSCSRQLPAYVAGSRSAVGRGTLELGEALLGVAPA